MNLINSNALFVISMLACQLAAIPTYEANLDFQKILTGQKGGHSVPVGEVISACTVKGKVALTFDDGPYNFTKELVDILNKHDAKATFFVNGANWTPNIDAYKDLLEKEYKEGHQIASHTLHHKDLTKLPYDQILMELDQMDDILERFIGRRPTYLRLPYLAYNNTVLNIVKDRGYHIIGTDLDTNGWRYDGEYKIENSFELFKQGLDSGGTIALAPDVHLWTVKKLAGWMLDELKKRNLTPVTVGECLGAPPEEWYRAPSSPSQDDEVPTLQCHTKEEYQKEIQEEAQKEVHEETHEEIHEEFHEGNINIFLNLGRY